MQSPPSPPNRQRRHRDRQPVDQAVDAGFSLIELLVVVIIIGILAAIAIPTFLSQRQGGWQAQLASDVRNAILDVEAEFVTNDGRYPADQDEFEALGAVSSDPSITLTYATNASQNEFCVLGTDTRQPADRRVAHYVNNSGVQIFEECPAHLRP